ncbi:hypothetical protein PBV87_10470 [Niameybacter massiliensis]|uniref:Uncharacterized protein n=1 Tax=Holtiella tumoricola TaxID=3018743 RepID=A0AA42DMW8_9FIRM|nr:hypothetical protein [Holtiella tumoricola]MDA3731903.1 hypothetical protein [Holtiella tumoricola]
MESKTKRNRKIAYAIGLLVIGGAILSKYIVVPTSTREQENVIEQLQDVWEENVEVLKTLIGVEDEGEAINAYSEEEKGLQILL